MHPEADAFLDAIFDHPDDDTVRLVYADWLEEHDQGNYAQFIRLQCAAAREKLWSDEANRLWEEIGRVWTRLDAEWWPATRDVWGDEYSDGVLLDAIHFERGLLRIHVTINTFHIERYPDCWAWLPSCEVWLSDINDLERLASMPIARRLRSVGLASTSARGVPTNELNTCLTLFVRSEFTRKVRVLDLTAVHLRKQMVQSLMREKSLPGLEELRVTFGRRSDCYPEETIKQLEERYERVVWE